MGFRFRKSIKIAPGIKLNLGKKSAGLSIGNKYGGFSINSRSGLRSRVSVPGTGISYTQKIGGKKRAAHKKAPSQARPIQEKSLPEKPLFIQPVPQRLWYKVIMVLFILSGASALVTEPLGGAVCLVGGLAMLYFWKKTPGIPKIDEATFRNDLRIFDDSVRLFKETTQPETFFTCYDNACAAVFRMAEQTDASLVHNESPQTMIELLNREKTDVTNDFLDRFAKEIRMKAYELTRGRKAKIESFYLITAEYDEKMTWESKTHRDKLYQEMKEKIESVE